MTNSNPITQNEHLEIIDVLRGLAVCGILIANIQLFSGALFELEVFRDQAPLADRIAQVLIQFFVGGKFYSIFSFLFGFGFALQIERAEQRGDTEARLFKRRLYWMLVIGFLHAFLLWYGDILSIYAMTGFFLIKFRRTDNSSILRWAVALILFPIITYTLVYVVYTVFFTPAAVAPNNEEAINTYNQIVNFVSTANFPMMLPVNVTLGLPQRYIGFLYEMRFTKILGMFLLGLYAYRMGILQHISAHLFLIKRVFWWGLALGLGGNSILSVLMLLDVYQPPTSLGILQTAGYAIGVHSLALCYIAGVILLYRQRAGQLILSIFAPVGRMALTNYLLQTVICCLLFYGYGLGWYGKVGAEKTAYMAFAIFFGQVVFSFSWFKFFTYGPTEWLWRRLTYKQKISLRCQ